MGSAVLYDALVRRTKMLNLDFTHGFVTQMNKMCYVFHKTSVGVSPRSYNRRSTATHLERDGVDDALALHPLQTGLHNGELGRIDHERDLRIDRTTTEQKSVVSRRRPSAVIAEVIVSRAAC